MNSTLSEPSKAQLMEAIEEIKELIQESQGLMGFHIEDRVTTWQELRERGFLDKFDKVPATTD